MGLSTEDRLDIQDLYARYNHAIDSGNGDAWAATFTPDGVFESAQGTQTGSESLKQFASGFASRLKGRHWINNLVMDEAPGGANGSCYLVLYNLGGEKPSILATAIYNDELTKTASGWRFAKRVVNGD
jgi:hypothetical protein